MDIKHATVKDAEGGISHYNITADGVLVATARKAKGGFDLEPVSDAGMQPTPSIKTMAELKAIVAEKVSAAYVASQAPLKKAAAPKRPKKDPTSSLSAPEDYSPEDEDDGDVPNLSELMAEDQLVVDSDIDLD